MIEKINKPCFWFYNSELPEKDQCMKAACVNCQNKLNLNGWYWQGHIVGYGNYNLNCEFCNEILSNNEDYQKEIND